MPGKTCVPPSNVFTWPDVMYGPKVGATWPKNVFVGSGYFSRVELSLQKSSSFLFTWMVAFGNILLPPTGSPPLWSGWMCVRRTSVIDSGVNRRIHGRFDVRL